MPTIRPAVDPVDEYMVRLAHVSQRLIGAVHDEGPAMSAIHLDTLLGIEPPEGVDPYRAIVAVLAAQVDPRTSVEDRLGWVTAGLEALSPVPDPDYHGINHLAGMQSMKLPPVPTDFDDIVLEQVVGGIMPLESLARSRRREAVERLHAQGMTPMGIAARVRAPSKTVYRLLDEVDELAAAG